MIIEKSPDTFDSGIKENTIMEKKPFVTKSQVEEIVKTYPTPFHLYDEKGIRENAKAVKEAFAWNPNFREYFAVKATPNPYILKILQDYDMGCDCSSYTELMLAKSCGFDGKHIMFSSNDTPAEEFAYAEDVPIKKTKVANFLSIYYDYLSTYQKEMIEAYSNFENKNIINKYDDLIKYKMNKQSIIKFLGQLIG